MLILFGEVLRKAYMVHSGWIAELKFGISTIDIGV